MQGTWVQSLDQEDPLEKEMATHSRILAWRIPVDRGAWQATVHAAAAAAAAAKLLQSCPTMCDPIDGSPPGSPVPCRVLDSWWERPVYHRELRLVLR